MNITAVVLTALLLLAQDTPLQRARQAFVAAQQLESALNEKPAEDRARNEYVRVIEAYQRVYIITPHTGYADNALMTIARLYEEIKESRGAIRTLNFLLREYPRTPFRDAAEKDLARLQGIPERKSAAVENVRYWDGSDSVRVVVDVSGDATYVQGKAKSPDRVFIDVTPARLSSMLAGKQWPVKSGLLEQIRVGQYDSATVRVVLDVGAIAQVTSFRLRDPDRIVIDVLGKGASAPSSESSPPAALESNSKLTPRPAAPSTTPPPAVAEPRRVETGRVVKPAKPTDRGDHSLIRSLGLKLSRVVVDAGHGGYDTGTVGPTGYTEKELVLDVSLRLKQLIETALGAEVLVTRSDDSFVPLENRTALANQQRADLFISIHANSSRIRSVRGVETFFLNFTTSREALETASRENAASERSIHELQDIVKKIMLRDKVDESRELAGHIQRAMAGRKSAGNDRGVKQAPFVVLIGANMPAVLAEISFISNPQEERQLKSPEYRQQIAEALFDGVKSYGQSLSGLKTAKSQDKNQD